MCSLNLFVFFLSLNRKFDGVIGVCSEMNSVNKHDDDDDVENDSDNSSDYDKPNPTPAKSTSLLILLDIKSCI